MEYKQLKEKLERIIEIEQKIKGHMPGFGNLMIKEYHQLKYELANVGYEDLKNYHSLSVLEKEILKKQLEKNMQDLQYAHKLAMNKIAVLRRIINSDKEIKINDIDEF